MLSESIESEEPTTQAAGGPQRVREAVIEAARKLFAERGIHAVSVREIAREVGVSHTLLHLYFGSKQEIVRQVLGLYDNGFARRVATTDALDCAVGDVFRSVATDLELYRVFAAALVEGIVPARIAAEPTVQQALVQRLEEIRDTDSADPRAFTACVASMMVGWAVAGDWITASVGADETSQEELSEAMASLLERMVRDCS